jgi:hypothetical protein
MDKANHLCNGMEVKLGECVKINELSADWVQNSNVGYSISLRLFLKMMIFAPSYLPVLLFPIAHLMSNTSPQFCFSMEMIFLKILK